jgi:hypothetical protein
VLNDVCAGACIGNSVTASTKNTFFISFTRHCRKLHPERHQLRKERGQNTDRKSR